MHQRTQLTGETEEGRKILANHISEKGLISGIYEELLKINTSNNKRKKQPKFRKGKDLNKHFCKENTQMTSKKMKRYSTSLVIREK